MPATSSTADRDHTAQHARHRRQLAIIFVAMTVLAIIVLVGARLVVAGKRVPALTRSDFDAAWQRWESHGLQNYTITTVVEGRQPATYWVQFVDGNVVSATRNDHPLPGKRTIGTWSVPGMFDTIEHDLETIDSPQPSLQLELRCMFDETWGYPRKYIRSDYTSGTTTRWLVTDFSPVDQEDTKP